jgi:hypothetical protein
MAFGIDDALTTAAAGINLADTCVKIIRAYRKKGAHLDIERLIEEVRITALQRIDDADMALLQLEHTLVERGVDLSRTLLEVIEKTPFWHPYEAHRLKRIRRSFTALSDATYSAIDDIQSLVRCCNQTGEMGRVIVDSVRTKQEFLEKLRKSTSFKHAIDLLRKQLLEQKVALD